MLKKILILSTLLKLFACQGYPNISTERFPDDFIFGTGSSSYQVEGAWNEDGKGESMWDYITHKRSELIRGGGNADIAGDSYHKFEDDLELLKNLGVDFYRFSLSWPRILPSGFPNTINQAGVDYYNNIIDSLLANNITPVVTMLHFDIPLPLYEMGGFANPIMAQWFEDYAKVVLELFGDRVKFWITINEPKFVCLYGQGNEIISIGAEVAGIGDYICGHHVLQAHARVFHLYNDTFRTTQGGKIGLTLNSFWYEPKIKNSTEDGTAAGRAMQFQVGWFGHPIYSQDGDYPEVMKEFIANRSMEEGFSKSRLPVFTLEEIQYIKGTSDFFGLNYYTAYLVANKPGDPIGDPSVEKDTSVELSSDPTWPNSTAEAFKVVPWGLRKLLKWLHDNYDNPEIYITENGYAGDGSVHDPERADFHHTHLSNLLDAIYIDGVQVKGYCLWSFLDQFELYMGYTVSFGIHQVDFSDPNRTRTPKDSALYYAGVIKNRTLPYSEDGLLH